MSSLRNAATVSGVALCPRTASARSPGSASIPTKIRTEITHRVTSPRPMRLSTRAAIPLGLNRTMVVNDHFRLGLEPPALRRPKPIQLPVSRQLAMADRVAGGGQVGAEHGYHHAAVVAHDALHLPIHGTPFVLIQFGPRRHEQFVEARVIPEGIVPGGTLGVGGGEHHVFGGPAAPEDRAPGFFHPHIAPVPIVGLADHIDGDTGLGGLLPVEHTGVHRTLEGRLGRVKLEGGAIQAGFLQMESGLVRIILPLGQVTGMIAVGHADGMIVAHPTVAAQDGLDHLLPVHGVFQGQAHVVVVVWRHVGTHGESEMFEPILAHHLDAGHALEQVHGLEIATVHHIDLTGLERIGAGVDIIDTQNLHLVEPGPIGFEIIGIAHGKGAHPGLEGLDFVPAGENPRGKVGALGAHHKMVVAQGEGKVGVAAFQFERQGVLVLFFHADDRFDQRLGSRFGARLEVPVDGIDHVVGVHGFAVVELDALAQVKNPFLGIRCGFPSFGQLGCRPAVGIDLHQAVGQGAIHQDLRHHGQLDARIKGVRGGAAVEAQPQPAATFGAFCIGFGGECHWGNGSRQSHGRCIGDKRTARKVACRQHLFQAFQT
ncbi:hypothetical protein DESC_860011 [Desulfosarcina cetonica]|nr:hypothetical protein DESC_860011 [Desulfosarcina cetonica]